jgi:chitinase
VEPLETRNLLAATLSIGNVSLPEGNSGTTSFDFPVTLSKSSTQTVTVQYATADDTAKTSLGDYQAVSGTLTFNPGDTAKTVSVPVNGNTLNEPDETFFVNLSNPVNSTLTNSQGTGTILNDDPYPTLSIANQSKTIGTSGTTKFNFTVSLSTASGQTVSVSYATADGTAMAGTDYQAASGSLTFTPGQTSETIPVSVFGTTAIEPFKNFFVNLSGNSHAILLLKQGTGTILNNNLKVSIAGSINVTESAAGYTWANFPVSLSAAASFPVTVNFATGGGTAVPRTDYVDLLDGLVTFTPGQTTQVVSVPVIADAYDGVNRTFNLTLSNPTNAVLGTTWKGTCTITDVPPAVSVTSLSQAEGNSGTTPFPFTISLAAPAAEAVTVTYATADGTGTAGTDYQATSGTLSFAAGVTSQNVTVPVIGNTTPQPDRTFYLTATGPQNSAQGTGTILDDDPDPLVSISSVMLPPGTSGTTAFNFTVSLSSASTQTVSVPYATADGTAVAGTDYQAQSGTLNFLPGQTSQPISVLVNGNPTVGPDKVFYVNLTGATHGRLLTSQGVGTILNESLGLSINDVTLVQPTTGVTSADFLVTLSAAAPFPVTVNYTAIQFGQNTNAAPGQDYLPISGSLTFAPGQTSQTVSVPVFGEYYSEANETFGVKLSGAGGATITRTTGTATLINTTPLTLAVTNVTQLEGNSGLTAFVFTVTLTGAPHEQTVSVQYATADGTAKAGTDYQGASGTVLLKPYQTKVTITVSVNGNTTVEPDKTFFLNLTSAFGTAQGVGTIVNDDGPF